MRLTRIALTLLAALACARPAIAQPAPRGATLVMPFDNAGREPRVFWLTEGAAVLLADYLNALGANAITRDERVRAFDRLQISGAAALSHATVIRIGQLVGAAEVVIGSLALHGEELEARARAIRLETGTLQGEIVERGPLTEVLAVFERIARRLVPNSPPLAPGTLRVPSLAAFENFIKGLLAETPTAQAAFLSAALKLAPEYDEARLALWTLHDEQSEHDQALQVAKSVPGSSPLARRARFYSALSQIHLKRLDEALATLTALAKDAPTGPVMNNIGVVLIRLGGSPEAGRPAYYFLKATETEPAEADYFFNLGYAYWLDRNMPTAVYWLREAVRRNAADGDAHFVLGAALAAQGATAEAAREKELARQLSSTYAEWERPGAPPAETVPRGLERLATEPDPARTQRLDLALSATERRDQQELAAFHLERGRRLFDEERDREAIGELRRSLYLSPYQAEANLLLGRAYLRIGRLRDAVDALRISVWSGETAAAQAALGEALLLLKDEAGAKAAAARALALDPASADAKRLLEKLSR